MRSLLIWNAVNLPSSADPVSSDIVDKTEVTVGRGKTVKIRVKKAGSYMPNPTWDPSMISCKWGDWDGGGWPFYITGGEYTGETEIIIHKGKGGKEVARVKVKVK